MKERRANQQSLDEKLEEKQYLYEVSEGTIGEYARQELLEQIKELKELQNGRP